MGSLCFVYGLTVMTTREQPYINRHQLTVMKNTELGKTGEKIPVIGQGTWGLERWKSPGYYEKWKQSLRKGIELGMNHIDTAEVYGWGKAESIVSDILKEYNRDDLFITSKLFPIHFTHRGMKKALYKSLERLCIDCLDLYLIHWPNPLVSIERQMKVLEELAKEGKTRYIGVSNFSVNQFKRAQNCLKKEELVTNQVRASVVHQHHIHESLPYYQKEQITMTAYSPLGHRGLTNLKGVTRENLEVIAAQHSSTIQQVALAWLVNMDNVITIPKTVQISHVEANASAADITLSPEESESLMNY